MPEPLFCISSAQLCDWLAQGELNGITIKRLGEDQGYSIAFTVNDQVLVSSLSDSINDGIAGCYDGANEVLNQIEARMDAQQAPDHPDVPLV